MESHPEYAFLALNNIRSLSALKHTEEGKAERISILRAHCDGVDELVAKYLSDVPGSKKIDDLLDALLAVIGSIGVAHGFSTIPEQPLVDATGLRMQIVFAEI